LESILKLVTLIPVILKISIVNPAPFKTLRFVPLRVMEGSVFSMNVSIALAKKKFACAIWGVMKERESIITSSFLFVQSYNIHIYVVVHFLKYYPILMLIILDGSRSCLLRTMSVRNEETGIFTVVDIPI